MHFALSKHPLNPGQLREEMLDTSAGAFCVFEGWIRDHHLGKPVTSLTYDAYDSMAIKQGESVLDDALGRFDILDARAVHRVGSLAPGDLAVWIGVTAVHRGPAFAACQSIIDAIKDSVPIWKHEFYADGTDEWVDPSHCTCSVTPHPHA